MGTEEIGVAQSQSINHHLQLYQPPPPHMNTEFRNSGSSFSDDEGSEDEEDEVEGIADLDSKDGSKLGWKEGNVVVAGSGSDLRNAVTIVESGGGSYDAQSSRGGEKGVGFSGRKEGSHVSESMESLRTILSDPVTGRLMDDAMILRCGHSFGNGGLEHVLRMKKCYTCLHDVSEDSAAPNILLRAAVQAFRREEELHASRASKRRRERYDQEKGCYGDSAPLENSRRKGVQFPFNLTDRVIIKGNKRTPPRFVGREAIVVNQCLNGWYVVKTVDNSEQVKLQYRSLAKVSDSQSSNPTA